MIFNPDDLFIGRSLDFYGEYSEREVEIFREFIHPGDLVIEGGANIGCHTLAFARLVGEEGRVVAFEPERSVFYTLCGNLAVNNLFHVQACHAALGDHQGTIHVPSLDYNKCISIGMLSLETATNAPEYYEVPLYTIDALEVLKCNFIKADVEGMETKLLHGATETIDRFHPILYVENDKTDKASELKNFIGSLGYTLYYHLPHLHNQGNFYEFKNNVFGDTISCNLLCLPNGMELPFGDLESRRLIRWHEGDTISVSQGKLAI